MQVITMQGGRIIIYAGNLGGRTLYMQVIKGAAHYICW
jgi:hypothetical protein